MRGAGISNSNKTASELTKTEAISPPFFIELYSKSLRL